MANEMDRAARRRRKVGLLELAIIAAAVCLAGAIITLAVIGASAGT